MTVPGLIRPDWPAPPAARDAFLLGVPAEEPGDSRFLFLPRGALLASEMWVGIGLPPRWPPRWTGLDLAISLQSIPARHVAAWSMTGLGLG